MGIETTWLGQGGYIFTLGDKKIAIDPHLSDSLANKNNWDRLAPIALKPKELKVDLIICTHDHMDHLDEGTLQFIDWSNTRCGGPDSCLEHLRRLEIPGDKLVKLNMNTSIQLGGATIYGVYAYHLYAGNMVDSIGVVIDFDGTTIYIVGDSLYHKRLLEVKALHPDVLICCINGRLGNMNYKEAADLARELAVKIAIPSHYGMYRENTEDPRMLQRVLDPSIEYVELELNRPHLLITK
ncbi:MAG: MBL fold metallo-hydrolase [Peptococcaceae bacterium]|nr:MBL fold metallo-hydrolase [Peptococcaceae bacterium]